VTPEMKSWPQVRPENMGNYCVRVRHAPYLHDQHRPDHRVCARWISLSRHGARYPDCSWPFPRARRPRAKAGFGRDSGHWVSVPVDGSAFSQGDPVAGMASNCSIRVCAMPSGRGQEKAGRVAWVGAGGVRGGCCGDCFPEHGEGGRPSGRMVVLDGTGCSRSSCSCNSACEF
jgi:hypothetical protein